MKRGREDPHPTREGNDTPHATRRSDIRISAVLGGPAEHVRTTTSTTTERGFNGGGVSRFPFVASLSLSRGGSGRGAASTVYCTTGSTVLVPREPPTIEAARHAPDADPGPGNSSSRFTARVYLSLTPMPTYGSSDDNAQALHQPSNPHIVSEARPMVGSTGPTS